MAKNSSTTYICSVCGNQSSRWHGRCFSCGSWNTYVEKKAETKSATSGASVPPLELISLKQSGKKVAQRINTAFDGFDRVLGGGLVPGSVILLGGEPGSGKSTLLLQYADAVAQHGKVFYLSGEESTDQILLRADRLQLKNRDNVFLSPISFIEEYFEKVSTETEKPVLVVVDSIQTVQEASSESRAGSVSQVQTVVDRLVEFAKVNTISTILVGHVTKEGNLAGPKTVEHLVDVVLYLEGDGEKKLIRSVKNRFGSVNELALFNFEQGFFVETQPTFLDRKKDGESTAKTGAVATIVKEGGRFLPLEIQTLVVQSYQQVPRRVVNGYDYNRLLLLIGILEKYTGAALYRNDVYVNVSEGIRIYEPAADLAICVALLSSLHKASLSHDLVVWGEVSLLGEILGVPHQDQRVKEAKRYGFTSYLTPQQLPSIKEIKKFIGKKERV
jgi:DNA repair protein RadA/Sms